MGKCPICEHEIDKFLKSNRDNMRICPNCKGAIIDFLLVRIVKIPDGPAPEWVRKTWVGLNLLAEPFDGARVDLQELIVPKDLALDVLRSVSLEAEEWFNRNFPEHMENLVFALNEAEIIEEFSMVAPLSFIEGIETQ